MGSLTSYPGSGVLFFIFRRVTPTTSSLTSENGQFKLMPRSTMCNAGLSIHQRFRLAALRRRTALSEAANLNEKSR
jgi:hypothetical protein